MLAFILVCGAVGLVITIRLIDLVCTIRRDRAARPKPDYTRAYYLHDRALANQPHHCVCCGGTSTMLKWVAPDGIEEHGAWLCADRKLCRQTMIFTSMLKSSA